MNSITQFDSAMQIIAEKQTSSAVAGPLRLAVAYSGGLDSAVLLHLACAYAKQSGSIVMAFHVHHGLSPHADAWVMHCQAQCAALDVPFEVQYIDLGSTSEVGVEATARNKRYAALGRLCTSHHIDVLLTAHHQDDQAETILLQLLRGSGVAGLCGMQQCHPAAQLLGSDSVLLARPLLDVTRAEIEGYATQNEIAHIEDESNLDARYLRNALRLKIMPLLADYFPGYQSRFARSAQHAQHNLELIEQLAHQDYVDCLVAPGSAILNAERLQLLPDARLDNVLRYWIAAHHRKMPSTARLAQMRKQLLTARDDARVCVKHGDMEVHRYRQQLSISGCAATPPPAQKFTWQGEAVIAFPAFSGTLQIDPVESGEAGIRRDWLLAHPLEIRLRQGGERMKLAANRPNRDMKSHYQTFGIPYWQRERLPFIFSGNELVYAAGIGISGVLLESADQCVTLRWVANTE